MFKFNYDNFVFYLNMNQLGLSKLLSIIVCNSVYMCDSKIQIVGRDMAFK